MSNKRSNRHTIDESLDEYLMIKIEDSSNKQDTLKMKKRKINNIKLYNFETLRQVTDSPTYTKFHSIRSTIQTHEAARLLPFSIKNLDTGEVTNEDPFIREIK
jgi:hypothetical protein